MGSASLYRHKVKSSDISGWMDVGQCHGCNWETKTTNATVHVKTSACIWMQPATASTRFSGSIPSPYLLVVRDSELIQLESPIVRNDIPCTCVCMHACTYVRMYVCKYLSMSYPHQSICVCVKTYVCMNVRTTYLQPSQPRNTQAGSSSASKEILSLLRNP
jgi:hypothetical protein